MTFLPSSWHQHGFYHAGLFVRYCKRSIAQLCTKFQDCNSRWNLLWSITLRLVGWCCRSTVIKECHWMCMYSALSPYPFSYFSKDSDGIGIWWCSFNYWCFGWLRHHNVPWRCSTLFKAVPRATSDWACTRSSEMAACFISISRAKETASTLSCNVRRAVWTR